MVDFHSLLFSFFVYFTRLLCSFYHIFLHSATTHLYIIWFRNGNLVNSHGVTQTWSSRFSSVCGKKSVFPLILLRSCRMQYQINLFNVFCRSMYVWATTTVVWNICGEHAVTPIFHRLIFAMFFSYVHHTNDFEFCPLFWWRVEKWAIVECEW